MEFDNADDDMVVSLEEGLEKLENYTRMIVEAVVDDPALIKINCAASDNMLMVLIRGDRTECSKIIGQSGRTINSMRVVLYAIARKYDCYIKIEVHSTQEEGDRPARQQDRPVRQSYNR